MTDPDPHVLAADRVKAVLDRHGVTRAMVEQRANAGRSGRRLIVDLNAVQFGPRIVAAMVELISEASNAATAKIPPG